MPNKTIYVTEDDLPTFERAQELAGDNLSATIAQALDRYIQSEEAKEAGYEEITLKEGDKGTYTRKRFIGRELARTHMADRESRRVKVLTVYETAKHNFVLYTREKSNLSLNELANQVNRKTENLTEKLFSDQINEKINKKLNFEWDEDLVVWSKPNAYHLKVFESFDAIKEQLPEELASAAEHALHDGEEFLDI